MRIVSFNTNGIRARRHQLEALRDQYDPDIIGIQHMAVYQAHYFGQKTHYGVALLSKRPPLKVQKGFPGDGGDAQRRFIMGVFETADGQPLSLINGYFPQGESRDHEVKFPAKRKFYADMLAYLNANFTPDDRLLLS